MKVTEQQYHQAIKVLNDYKQQLFDEIAAKKLEAAKVESEIKRTAITPDTEIIDLEMSVRLYNLLIYPMQVKTVRDIAALNKDKFLSNRRAGKKSWQELVSVCATYGIPIDNK